MDSKFLNDVVLSNDAHTEINILQSPTFYGIYAYIKLK